MKKEKTRLIIFLVIVFVVSILFICSCDSKESVAITNVRVFDGEKLSAPTTVVIKDGLIVDSKKGSVVIDGNGGTLLPGFIDSHLHVEGKSSMEKCAFWGVTTVFDMGGDINEIIKLRSEKNLPAILASGISAAPVKGVHAKIGCIPLSNIESAEVYIQEKVKEGVDYIKIIVDSPDEAGFAVLDKNILETLVKAAHKNNLKVVSHVTLNTSIGLCIETDVDVITHLPLTQVIDKNFADEVAGKGIVSVPTLIMMQCFAKNAAPGTKMNYKNAHDSFAVLNSAGVTIFGGTDANSSVCPVEFGKSLHEELKLMVDAGMTEADALRSVTSAPAKYFGLKDKGVIAPGLKADLILIDGNPLEDISATGKITGVWIDGQRVR